MSFLDGFAKGMQMVNQAVLMKEGIADREAARAYRQQDAARADRIEGRQGTLTELQIEQARRDAENNKAMMEAEAEVKKAGKVAVTTSFLPGKKEGELDQMFEVGGQQFNNRADADAHAAGANTPVAVARRQYARAQELGVPQLAKQYGDLYTNARTSTEADFKQAFNEAMRNGGVEGVVQLYNSQVKDGRQLVAQRGPGGKLTVGTYVGGKLQGQPVTYGDEKEFLAEQVARYTASPDAYLDAFHKTRAFGESARQFDAQMDETTRSNKAREGTASAAVGVQRQGVELQGRALDKPVSTVIQTVNPTGTGTNLGVVQTHPSGKSTYNSVGEQAGITRPPKVDPLAEMLKGRNQPPAAGGKAGFQLDENGLARLDQMMNPGGR